VACGFRGFSFDEMPMPTIAPLAYILSFAAQSRSSMKKLTFVTVALMAATACCVLLQRCGEVKVGPVTVTSSGDFFPTLSQYNFFQGRMADLIPNERVLPYDLNSALFSDYAHKARFVWMPEGTSAAYTDEGSFVFSVGTVLIKNFYYPHDFREESKGRRIMETRLLINRDEGWVALPYIWNKEQTEATLEVAGGREDISWIHTDGSKREVNYVIPNKNQCKGCHETSKVMTPIGPQAKHLNRIFAFAEGEQNQLEKWTAMGYLKGAPAASDAPRLAAWDDPATGTVENRARAWLDINCAHCHSPKGPANTSGFHLNIEETDCMARGVMKNNIAAGRGSGGLLYDIVPGNADSSIIVFRMASADPGIMMPELGRKLVHEESLALIREWISAMDAERPCLN
jgi:uncharacterized repeat protein (TIGR03806 family)